MPHYFFFSYARANNDSYLQRFFEDLSDKIRDILGFSKDKQVGFFDQKDLELGAEWDKELATALQACPVLVSLYSPAYFNSLYCGKEWECFRRRRALYADNARKAGMENVGLPPVIKPVIWIPLRPSQKPPTAVGGPQYKLGDPEAVHNVTGLKTMRKQLADYENAYETFINQLANETLDAVEKFSLPEGKELKEWLDLDPPKTNALPPLVPFPVLREVESAFHTGDPNQKGASPLSMLGRRRGGPKFVRFVVVAAKPDEFQQNQRATEFYLDFGGGDWKPYLPDVDRTLMTLAQVVAGELDIRSDELPFDGNLPQEIRNAETDRCLVVMFVDGWTAELPPYRQRLTAFDQNNYLNCSIFIPWNYKDPETVGRGDQLKQLLRKDIFPRWSRFANLNEPIYFRDSISSVEDLRDQLRTTLTQLQSLIGKDAIEHATKNDIPRRIETDISKPILSHKDLPGGANV